MCLIETADVDVAGKAVVVRARADDFKTEADDGDAGEIVAVGIIKAEAA